MDRMDTMDRMDDGAGGGSGTTVTPRGAARPVVKWAGGKRQLLSRIRDRMPGDVGTYHEPFLGGGALFLDLAPGRAVINDANPQLVNLYRRVRDDPEGLMAEVDDVQGGYNRLGSMGAKDAEYLALRDEFNVCLERGTEDTRAAALMLFLNKAGFNGLFRVNGRGMFNVPPAHRAEVHAYDRDNIMAVSEALGRATILCGDFGDACRGASEGDFVFLDSPYHSTFDTYRAGGFSEDDHRRLARLFGELSDRGVACMLTNSDTPLIRELYGDFHVEEVDVRRAINRDGSGRRGRELIVTNPGAWG